MREDLAEGVTCELRTTETSKGLRDKHSRQREQKGMGLLRPEGVGKMEEFEGYWTGQK